MKMFSTAMAAVALFATAGCGGEPDRAEKVAEQLDEAADQSYPAAEPVLENAAEAIREQEQVASPSQPGSLPQNALEKAGDRAAEPVLDDGTADPQMQARQQPQ